MNSRCAKVEELINLLEYDSNQGNVEKTVDTQKIKELVKDLILIFGKTSKTEIEVLNISKFFIYIPIKRSIIKQGNSRNETWIIRFF